jgi:hypothetical protein
LASLHPDRGRDKRGPPQYAQVLRDWGGFFCSYEKDACLGIGFEVFISHIQWKSKITAFMMATKNYINRKITAARGRRGSEWERDAIF